jgi:hypothetical protein
MKVTISKNKLKKIESLLYAGFGAFAIVISMENGKVTDNSIKIRDKTVTDIIKLLN